MTDDLVAHHLAACIDSTLLKAEAAKDDIIRCCQEACQYEMAAVCVNPGRLKLVIENLKGSQVAPCTVVGFPLGSFSVEHKLVEIDWALSVGAREIDMVMNIGLFKDREIEAVAGEIGQAVNLTRNRGALLKVIVETSALSEEELRKAAFMVLNSGADFIKTSTGYGARGVSLEDLRIIRETVGHGLKVKASGGIRTHDFAVKLLKAGADRLGTSNAIEIVKGEA